MNQSHCNSPRHIGNKYLHFLTDEFSIWQHSHGVSINTSEGYALDDAARGLITALVLDEVHLAKTYLSFLHQACCMCAQPVNFFDEQKQPVNRPLSLDALGEVWWALSVAKKFPTSNLGEIERIEASIAPYLLAPTLSIRPLAYAALSQDQRIVSNFKICFDTLWEAHSTDLWPWPEDSLTYANALIPLAVLTCLGSDEDYAKKAYTMLHFLNSTCKHDGLPCPIGNEHWFKRGQQKSIYAQQPIDVAYQVLANCVAYSKNTNLDHLHEANTYMRWFWGHNTADRSLIDEIHERCLDGIDESGVSRNSGSECIVCYLLAQKIFEVTQKGDFTVLHDVFPNS